MAETTTVAGPLEYLGWQYPTWKIGIDHDLKGAFWRFAEKNRDQPCRQEYSRGSYTLTADPEAEFDLSYNESGLGILLTKRKRGGFGFTNVTAYLEWALQALNGRDVIAEISDTKFTVAADPGENVFGVYFTSPGNSARIPDGAENSICKVGTSEACLFTSFSTKGFRCEKFSGSTAGMLLARKAEGTIRAQRIGNCALLGREEDKEAV